MKKIQITLIAVIAVMIVKAQDIDSITLSKLKLNFAVPDVPAFKALGTDPSNMLRPSTPQALAVSMSPFYNKSSKNITIPQAFALEISPALLINAKKNLEVLKKYKDNSVINSFRISLGSSSDSSLSYNTRHLALGMRINLIDEGNLQTDTEQQDKILLMLHNLHNTVEQSKRSFAKEKAIDTTKVDWDTAIANGGSRYVEFQQYLRENTLEGFDKKLKKIKEDFKAANWNKKKLELAVSLLGSSKDSLASNIRFNSFNFYGVYAAPIFTKSQIMAGLFIQTQRNLLDTTATKNNSYTNLSIPIRLLIGTNKVKGFMEAQYSYSDLKMSSNFFGSLGAEICVTDGIWLQFNGGIDYNFNTKNGAFAGTMNFKLQLPEKFNFF